MEKQNYVGLKATEKFIASMMLADKRLTAEANILLEKRIKFCKIEIENSFDLEPLNSVRFKEDEIA